MSRAVSDRDREVVRTTGGVYVPPGHWAASSVHSFHRWTGQTTLVTWCGIDVDLEDGARLTSDLITCLACGQASWQALRKGSQ
jgi:hypothetical protein